MEKLPFIDIEKIKAAKSARKHALNLLKKSEYGSGWKKIGRERVKGKEYYYEYSCHFVNNANSFCSVSGLVYPPNEIRSTHECVDFKIIPAKVG